MYLSKRCHGREHNKTRQSLSFSFLSKRKQGNIVWEGQESGKGVPFTDDSSKRETFCPKKKPENDEKSDAK